MSQQLKKNLPKRCTSIGLQARRQRSWERTQKRKEARRKVQEEQHRANGLLRAKGLPTPWEEAKIKARECREAQRLAAEEAKRNGKGSSHTLWKTTKARAQERKTQG